MATYAIALMVAGDNPAAREWAERARAVAANSDAPSVEADALVTLGQLSSRSGEADEAIGFALSRLCFEGPEAELTLTVNAQPAILAASSSLSARFTTAIARRPYAPPSPSCANRGAHGQACRRGTHCGARTPLDRWSVH